jgi:hypothetical protein
MNGWFTGVAFMPQCPEETYSGLQMGGVQINPLATRDHSLASYSMRLQTAVVTQLQ